MKYLMMCLLFFSINSYADALNEACIEKASMAVIDYLSAEESKSDLHLVKDSQNAVIGLTDSEDIFGNFDLDPIIENSPNESTVLFRDSDYIVFANVQTKDTNGKSVCKILDVDSGQDDQD